MKTIYKNIDKWLKIGLLVLSQILIVLLTISSIIFICISDEQYKQIYPNEEVFNLMIQVKESSKIMLCIVAPLSALIIPINSYKFYLYIKEKIQERKVLKQKGAKRGLSKK